MLLTGHFGMQLVRQTAGSWWVFMLRSVATIIFGPLIFLFPGLGLVFILAGIGAWMLFDGMGSIFQAIKGGQPTGGRARLWIDGVISLIAAAVILLAPGVSAIGLLIVTAAWFLLSGGARLLLAFRLSSVLLDRSGRQYRSPLSVPDRSVNRPIKHMASGVRGHFLVGGKGQHELHR